MCAVCFSYGPARVFSVRLVGLCSRLQYCSIYRTSNSPVAESISKLPSRIMRRDFCVSSLVSISSISLPCCFYTRCAAWAIRLCLRFLILYFSAGTFQFHLHNFDLPLIPIIAVSFIRMFMFIPTQTPISIG